MNAQMVDFNTLSANFESMKSAAKAEYEAKIVEYDKAFAVLEKLFKTASNGTTKSASSSKELPPKAFADMTILQATKSYLEYCHNKPQTSDELAKALKKYGIQSSSKDFPNTLRTILYKVRKNSKEVVRVSGKKWKLNPRKTI